jgi:hypothetical protein
MWHVFIKFMKRFVIMACVLENFDVRSLQTGYRKGLSLVAAVKYIGACAITCKVSSAATRVLLTCIGYNVIDKYVNAVCIM